MKNKTKFKQTETCGEQGRTIGRIPEGWEEKEIQEVADVVGGGTPSTKEADNFNGNIPWITPKDLSNYKFRHISRGERNISQKGLEQSSAKLLPANTILLTTRAPVGYVAISKNEVTTNQGFHSLISKSGVSFEFLYYLLKSNTEVLKSHASGTTFGELSGSTLKSLKFVFPELSEQRAIAKILSDLDEKIELNNQMNKTLESMAQAIFKEWFVDFHFPGYEKVKMVDSELGKIPLGWKTDKLDNCIEFFKGKKPIDVTEEKKEGYLPQILIETLNGGRFLYANKTNAIICEENDIIMVMDGASSGRVEIGFNGILGSTLAKVALKNDDLNNEYLYFILLLNEQDIKENTTGSAIPHADKNKILSTQIVIPCKEFLISFREIIINVFAKIRVNKKEIKTLFQLRDSLLPKLMSGKIRVDN